MKKLIAYFLTLLVFFNHSLLEASARESHVNLQKNSLAISVSFDAQGKLWRVAEKDGFIWVDASRDLGKTFSKPVQVNLTMQNIGADGEARPQIAIGPEGNIYLTWTEKLKKPFSGYIWFSRSIDAGKTFEAPIIVHQDRAENARRFNLLNVSQDGDNKGSVTVTWVDKQDLIAAKVAR
ncbi:MAG: sialidase family protein, partial [Methylotenera sp.]|nr:sialidase family protein [Methylotenera sp.]